MTKIGFLTCVFSVSAALAFITISKYTTEMEKPNPPPVVDVVTTTTNQYFLTVTVYSGGREIRKFKAGGNGGVGCSGGVWEFIDAETGQKVMLTGTVINEVSHY